MGAPLHQLAQTKMRARIETPMPYAPIRQVIAKEYSKSRWSYGSYTGYEAAPTKGLTTKLASSVIKPSAPIDELGQWMLRTAWSPDLTSERKLIIPSVIRNIDIYFSRNLKNDSHVIPDNKKNSLIRPIIQNKNKHIHPCYVDKNRDPSTTKNVKWNFHRWTKRSQLISVHNKKGVFKNIKK